MNTRLRISGGGGGGGGGGRHQRRYVFGARPLDGNLGGGRLINLNLIIIIVVTTTTITIIMSKILDGNLSVRRASPETPPEVRDGPAGSGDSDKRAGLAAAARRQGWPPQRDGKAGRLSETASRHY